MEDIDIRGVRSQLERIRDLTKLKPAPYNPRHASDEQLAGICRSIVEFGLVDPLLARREDGLLIGGHQRLRAVERLLAEPFRYVGRGGEQRTIQWQMPAEGIPVMFLEGLDDHRAKMLNLALNRATGDWEEDRLAQLLAQLHHDGFDPYELGATAFTSIEIGEYLEAGQASYDPGGEVPAPARQVPRLALEFTSKALRDAVKTAIAAASKGEETSGHTLARMLGVRPKAKGKPRARTRATA